MILELGPIPQWPIRKPRASGDDPIGADLLWTGIQ